jgi:hypothetical protein
MPAAAQVQDGWTPVGAGGDDGWTPVTQAPRARDVQPSTPGKPVGVEETAGAPGGITTPGYWTGSDQYPSVFGGLTHDLSSLWGTAKQAASAVFPTDPRQIKLISPGQVYAGVKSTVQDPLGAMYEAGPFTSALGIAGGAEAAAGAGRAVGNVATRGRVAGELTSLPQPPGTSLEAGTKLAERASAAPEAARKAGVQSYERIKKGPLGKAFVPDVPETPLAATQRHAAQGTREFGGDRTTWSSKRPTADVAAEQAYNAKRAKAGLAPQVGSSPSGKYGLSSITPEQFKASGTAAPMGDFYDITPDIGPESSRDAADTAKLGGSRAYNPGGQKGDTSTLPKPPTPGQPLAESLEEKSQLGRRETGIQGPSPSSRQLAQAHKVAETKLINAVTNEGMDPAPLVAARGQYAEAKQLGRQTAGVRAKAPGSLVDLFSNPKQLASTAQRVKVFEAGKAVRAQSTKDWYDALHRVAPDEVDGVMAHAEAGIVDKAVSGKTINGQQLLDKLKEYEDQGLRLPHHDKIQALAQTAVDKNYGSQPRMMKNLAATVVREGMIGAGAAGGGYAAYRWIRDWQ